jgi:hypothetical protein
VARVPIRPIVIAVAEAFFVDPVRALRVAEQFSEARYRIVAEINLHSGSIPLFDGHRLGEVPWLIDVFALDVRNVISKQLQRDHVDDRR